MKEVFCTLPIAVIDESQYEYEAINLTKSLKFMEEKQKNKMQVVHEFSSHVKCTNKTKV